MQPLILHHLNKSRSLRIVWLLEELKVPYEIKKYERDPKTMLAPESLRLIHPLGKSPIVTDPNNLNAVVAESGAITEYILDRYGKGRLIPAPGTPQRLRFTYWLHYAEGSLMPLMLLRLVFNQVKHSPAPFFVRPILKQINAKVTRAFIGPQLTLHLDYIESELQKSPMGWFVDDEMTAADVQMSFPLRAAMGRAGLNDSRPRTMDFLARIQKRPAFQAALQLTGETFDDL